MDISKTPPDIQKLIDNTYKDRDIPHICANGFITGMGTGDTFVILQLNVVPVEPLNFSYTVGKTIAGKLKEIISVLETKSSNTIMTVDQIEIAVKEGKN